MAVQKPCPELSVELNLQYSKIVSEAFELTTPQYLICLWHAYVTFFW